MVGIRHLNNAPITEALIDFRVGKLTHLKASAFDNLEAHLKASYPIKEPLRLVTGRFGFESGKPINVTEDKGIQGYIFKSTDEKNIGQFRIDGFTYNRLKPYTSWDAVIEQAKNLWQVYKTTIEPEIVTRIAVRYINNLTIPININEYITNPPQIPNNIPQTISSFLTRIVIQDSERELSANITQALEKNVEPNCVTIILDIDIYKVRDIAVDDDKNIWDYFNKMRELKNLIFFNSITEKTVEKYL